MSNWVHCNKCSVRPHASVSYYLTQCGHIFCERCTATLKSTGKCVVCTQTTTVLRLGKQIEPKILDYFSPIQQLQEKVMAAYQFQIRHRNNLFQNLLHRYNSVKKGLNQMNSVTKNLMKENQYLKSMIRSPNCQMSPAVTPGRFMTSTPVSMVSERTDFRGMNQSMVSASRSHRSSRSASSSTSRHSGTRMYPGQAKREGSLGSVASSIQKVPRTFEKPPKAYGIGTMKSLNDLGFRSTPR